MVGKSTVLIFSLFLAIAPAQAQGMEAGYYQTMSPSSSIGPDQDSLLPPEVVPLDPSTANALSASQAQTRQANMAAAGSGSVPGLADAPASAQDMRQQAFGQLMGDQSQMPQDAMQKIWRAGQKPTLAQQQSTPPGMPALPPDNNMAPPEQLMGTPPQLGAPNFQMANNQQMQQGYVAQSQTLTGGSTNQPAKVNTRRGGLSNFLNYAGAFGAGAMTSGFWSNNPWMGAAMFGSTMTGFGVRNNSRF